MPDGAGRTITKNSSSTSSEPENRAGAAQFPQLGFRCGEAGQRRRAQRRATPLALLADDGDAEAVGEIHGGLILRLRTLCSHESNASPTSASRFDQRSVRYASLERERLTRAMCQP